MTLADKFDTFLIDLDGVVYVGDSAVRGAPEAIKALRDAGKKVVFITNDPNKSSDGYAEKLASMGVDALPGEVVTSVMAARYYLRKYCELKGKSAFIIGSRTMKREFKSMGIALKEGTEARNADFVIVGGHKEFNYEEMKNASLAVQRGAQFIATNRDPAYPTTEGLVPGTGAILASIETASGKRARSVGKPGVIMFEAALDAVDAPGNAVVIGDRLDSDIEGGKNVNLPTVLALSGATTKEDVNESEIKPDYIINSLADLASTEIWEKNPLLSPDYTSPQRKD